MDKKIFSEVKDNIGIVWLNRPEKKNALNDELWFGLPELVTDLYTSLYMCMCLYIIRRAIDA